MIGLLCRTQAYLHIEDNKMVWKYTEDKELGTKI